MLSPKEKDELLKEHSPALLVSSEKKEGLKELKEAIFKKLSLIRVFLKPKTGEADLNDPLIVKKGTKISDLAEKTGIPIKRGAYVWGKSVKYPGQLVGMNHILKEKDIVSFN